MLTGLGSAPVGNSDKQANPKSHRPEGLAGQDFAAAMHSSISAHVWRSSVGTWGSGFKIWDVGFGL